MSNKLEKGMTLEERRKAIKEFIKDGQYEIIEELETKIRFKVGENIYVIYIEKEGREANDESK